VYNKVIAKDIDGKRNSHKSKSEDEIIKLENAIPAIIEKKDFEEVLVFEDYIEVVFKLEPILVQRSYGEPYHK